jgi:uncharacterized membrane protein
VRHNTFSNLLAILISASFLVSVLTVSVYAKPVQPSPEMSNWPNATTFGPKLRYENASGTIDEAFVGDGRSDTVADNSGWVAGIAVPRNGIALLGDDGNLYSKLCLDTQAPVQWYSWNVAFMHVGAIDGGTLSTTWENVDDWFVPQDYYIVLENSTLLGSLKDLRAGSINVAAGSEATPNWATLHIDNAVNVAVSPGSQTAGTGTSVDYTVTVYNTGRWNETYTLSATDSLGATTISFSPNPLSVSAGSSATSTMSVTLLTGNQTITVHAAGNNYEAADDATTTGNGLPISVVITPNKENGWTGDTVTDSITVTNLGATADNFVLTLGDTQGWAHGWDAPSQVIGTFVDNIHVPWGYTSGNYDATGQVAVLNDTQVAAWDNLLLGGNDKRYDNVNYGRAYNMYIQNIPMTGKAGTGEERAYIMFDLSSIPAGATIDSATLWLNTKYGPETTAAYLLENVYVACFSVPSENNATWKEGDTKFTGIPDDNTRWDNQPGFDVLQDNVYILSGDGGIDNLWESWNVTNAVTTFNPTDRVVSLGIGAITSPDHPDNCAMWFYGKDNYYDYGWPSAPVDQQDFRPRLVVTYQYPIENSISLGPGESWTGTLWTVVGGTPCTTDTLTVTATSLTDPSVTTSATKLVHNNVAGLTENITPSADSEANPGTYTFTVNITNTGGLADNFDLGVSDDQTWTPLFLNQSVVEIPAGVTDSSTIVTVTMPNATTGTVDTITVTENSEHQPLVGAVSTCTLTKLSQNATVEVTILPDPLNPDNIAHVSNVNTLINPAWSYDPLTYAVKIRNTGILDDKYVLTVVSDNSDMGLKLTPDEIFLPAGDTGYAALSITLPDSWLGNMQGTVTVIATGMLSKEYQQNSFPTDNDSVTVISGVENSVQKEILPDTNEPQTGAPGSPLVWVIVVKNTSNVTKDVTVEVTNETVTGNDVPRPNGWEAAIDTTSFLGVAAGATVQTYLRATVPSDAKTSEWDNITITASVPGATPDVEWVMAHALEPGPRIPEAVIEISVEAQVVSIEVWPNAWNFGVLDEDKTAATPTNYFTVRNTGNVSENIYVAGTDAQSMPGEPVTTWTLSPSIGVDHYVLSLTGVGPLDKTGTQQIDGPLAEGSELTFGLSIQAPSVITTPARMYARIKLTAVSNLWP